MLAALVAPVTVGDAVLLPAVQRVDAVGAAALGVLEIGHRGVDRREQLVVALPRGVVILPVTVTDRGLEVGGLGPQRIQPRLDLAHLTGIALQQPSHRLVILTDRGRHVRHRRGRGQQLACLRRLIDRGQALPGGMNPLPDVGEGDPELDKPPRVGGQHLHVPFDPGDPRSADHRYPPGIDTLGSGALDAAACALAAISRSPST